MKPTYQSYIFIKKIIWKQFKIVLNKFLPNFLHSLLTSTANVYRLTDVAGRRVARTRLTIANHPSSFSDASLQLWPMGIIFSWLNIKFWKAGKKKEQKKKRRGMKEEEKKGSKRNKNKVKLSQTNHCMTLKSIRNHIWFKVSKNLTKN